MFKIDGPLMNILSRISDLFILNILAIILCFPIITIGAVITAVYTQVYKMILKEEGYLVKEFFKAFKDNFKQATLLWLLELLFISLFLLDYFIVIHTSTSLTTINFAVLIIAGVFFAAIAIYVFPLQARFQNKIINTIKNALLISISHLPSTILILILSTIPALIICSFPKASFLLALFGISGILYINGFLLLRIFKKYDSYDSSEE